MKINTILECFNKVLDIEGNPRKTHFIAHSTLERKIGAVKTATTIITLHDPQGKDEDIIRQEYTTAMPISGEQALIEETQRRALVDFIQYWDNDKRTKQ